MRKYEHQTGSPEKKADFFLKSNFLTLNYYFSRGSLVLAFAASIMVYALEPTAERFRTGDIVVFICDSITHFGTYHAIVYDYYLTRFPAEHIRFLQLWNGGVFAIGATACFDWDIAAKRVTAATTIMLGVNRVGKLYCDIEFPSNTYGQLLYQPHARESHHPIREDAKIKLDMAYFIMEV